LDNPALALAELDGVRCLVLLGETGMGMSSELGAEFDRLSGANVDAVRFDLGAEPDMASLRDTVERSPKIAAWSARSGELVMLLDGFDEGNASMDKLVHGLALLDRLPTERLKLRIASRSSVWSHRLDDALRALSRESYSQLEIAQLTQSDAFLAPQDVTGDGHAFAEAIAGRDLGIFAARPLTLNMLLSIAKGRALPAGRIEIYERGLSILVRENHARRLEEHSTRVPGDGRLAGVRLLTAITLQSGRTVIHPRWTGEAPDEDVALDDVAVTAEELAAFDEVLDSGLFAIAGRGTTRWAHPSFAEFLAAARSHAGRSDWRTFHSRQLTSPKNQSAASASEMRVAS